MGTKVAVVLAILTVGYLEIKLHTILPSYFSNDYCLYIIKWWKRFIDDCFILWKKNKSAIVSRTPQHTSSLNQITKEEADANIPFLDILVIKTEQGTIEMDIFYKKTNAHRYLAFESAHPHKTKRNIPYTLAKRIIRIVSNEERQHQRLLELSHFLKHCNYPEGLINVNIERAKKPTTPNENTVEMEQDTLSFITTYCPSLSFDEHHIRKRLEGVQTDRLKRTFKDKTSFWKTTTNEFEASANKFCFFFFTCRTPHRGNHTLQRQKLSTLQAGLFKSNRSSHFACWETVV